MPRFLPAILAFVALLCLSACDNGGSDAQPPGQALQAPASTEVPGKAPPAAPNPPALDRETEMRLAGQLDFANRALEALARGRYGLASALHANSRLYLHTWRLAPRPNKGANTDIAVPAGLFEEADRKKLNSLRDQMDKSLDRLLGHYASLERYVRDRSIQDDGKLGRELAAKIDSAHTEFIGARRSWLEIVQKRAAEAEAALLAGHPLQRQIIASQAIFAQFREVASLLATGSPERTLLAATRNNIAALLANAEKPPFPARPGLERIFRAFLKQVGIYQAALGRGIDEGFHAIQRRELNQAQLECQKAYNEFAREANQ